MQSQGYSSGIMNQRSIVDGMILLSLKGFTIHFKYLL